MVMKDIENINDIQLLVDGFYSKIRNDEQLGSIFNGIIKNRWPEHLEKMYRFWQTILLDDQTYFGSPFVPHAKMPVDKSHFEQWIKLFSETVDENFAGEKAEVFVNYWSSEPGNAPDWEITICNKVRRTAESSKEYFFRFSNKPCIITIKLFLGTDNEETFSKEYTPMKNIKSFKMAVPTYAPRVGLDYDGSLISGDLSTELLARGVTLEMIQDVVWDYKYNGDVCSGYVDSNY